MSTGPQFDYPTGEVCDICGDVGEINAISKCFKCKINQQHFYCGKNYPQNRFGEWYCDDCERETTASPKHVNINLHKTLVASKNGKYWREEKMVTKGKVKCIPSEEVIKLSSGLKKGESPIKKTIKLSKFLTQTLTGAVRPGVEVKVASPGKEKYKASEASNTNFPRKQFPESIISAAVRPVVEVNVATPQKRISEASEASNTLSPEKPSHQLINSVAEPSVETKVGSLEKELYKGSEAANSLSPEKQFQQLSGSGAKDATVVKVTSTPHDGLCGQFSEKQFSPLTSPVKPSGCPREVIHKASEASNALSPKKQFPPPQSISPVLPAVETETGKEIFVSIESSCAQGNTSGHQVSGDLDPKASDVENSEAMNVEPKVPSLGFSWRGRFKIYGETFKNINSGFKAHPRFRVNSNVVDILLRMPELLQFKLISRRDVWIELFQDDCPDEDDIGLYFFPEKKRSSDYNFLRLFIEEKDLAMRYNLNGVELFLFTSKVLLADSQKLNGDYFIWGVFRPIKKERYVSKLYEKLPLVDHQASYSAQTTISSNNDDNDDDCAFDMEIDMVAGNNVGKVDVAVPRDSSFSAGHANKLSPFQEIKKEPELDCPPGFEEMFRLKKLEKL